MGLYVNESDMTLAYGESLLAKWSSRDATASDVDSDVVAQAILEAEGEVEDFFRDGPYAIPFVFGNARSEATVKRWIVTLAGERLFLPRSHQAGQRATPGTPTEREKAMNAADMVRREMRNYVHGGGPRLSATLSHSRGNSPTVI